MSEVCRDVDTAITQQATVDKLVKGKRDENLPLNHTLIKFLQHKYPLPTKEMKDVSYVISIMKFYSERWDKKD